MTFCHPGNKKKITTFVEIDDFINPKQIIPNMGMPISITLNADLIINFNIHYPKLSIKEKEIINDYFISPKISTK